MCFHLSLLTLTVLEIPAIYGSQLGKPQYDWGFFSVGAPCSIPPRSNLGKGAPSECKWEAHRPVTVRPAHQKHVVHLSYHRGKGLGGTSSINSFQFHPPPATDINGLSLAKLTTKIIYLLHTV
jgi:hypothetical protein